MAAEKGGICAFLGEECCFYANQSGLVRETAKQLLERIRNKTRSRQYFLEGHLDCLGTVDSHPSYPNLHPHTRGGSILCPFYSCSLAPPTHTGPSHRDYRLPCPSGFLGPNQPSSNPLQLVLSIPEDSGCGGSHLSSQHLARGGKRIIRWVKSKVVTNSRPVCLRGTLL